MSDSDSLAAVDDGVLVEATANAPDAIVVVDSSGAVLYWNHGAERIFGYPAREMVGRTLDPIIPERLRARHNKSFGEAMARGTTRYGEDDLLAVPALTAEGKTISVEFSITLLREGQGDHAVRYVMAIMRDVTIRWNREREMRRRVEAPQALQAREERGTQSAPSAG